MMYAPPPIEYEEAEWIIAILTEYAHPRGGGKHFSRSIITKLQAHFMKPGLGAMPGIRKADRENLYYIDDREAVTEALRYLVSLRAPREFSPLQTAISSLALMIGGNRRHVCDDGKGRIYELFPEDFAILAHAFTVHNAAKAKERA